MKKRYLLFLLILILLAIGKTTISGEFVAEEPTPTSEYSSDLRTLLVAEKIYIDEDTGEEMREEATNVDPGDIIEYIYYIENPGGVSAYYLEPSIPIPGSTNLIVNSILPQDDYLVSVDGEHYMEFPIYDKNKKEVPASAYKSVKWFIEELEPRGKIDVRLRVRVDS